MVSLACYDVEIRHRRADPIDYRLTFRAQTWLVDLDAVPELPGVLGRLCRFDPADHLGGGTVRAGLDRWLAERSEPAPHRVLMLANPRVLGYVFNPLTVFYCLDSSGAVSQIVAEVRNTYGGRHCYLLDPDAAGTAETDKAFYVSPFYPVDGHYRMRLPMPDERLQVSVNLHRPGEHPFVATMTGRRRPGTARLASALRTPLATRAVMLAIRRHGIMLYLKGLRPVRSEAAGQRVEAP